MASRRGVIALSVALAAITIGAVAFELMRSRRPLSLPIDATPPTAEDEQARIEGVRQWEGTTLDGRVLFQLIAKQAVVAEAGIDYLTEIESLQLPRDDGGWLRLKAKHARIEGLRDDASEARFVLGGGVEGEDSDGARFTTETLEIDTSQDEVIGPGPATVVRRAMQLRMNRFRYDRKQRLVRAEGAVAMNSSQLRGLDLQSSSAVIDLGQDRITFLDPLRITTAQTRLVARGGAMDLSGTGDSNQLELTAPFLVIQRSPDRTVQVTGDSLRLTSWREDRQAVVVEPSASALVEGITPDSADRATVAAHHLEIEGGTGKDSQLRGEGNVSAVLEPADGSPSIRLSARSVVTTSQIAPRQQNFTAEGDVRVAAQDTGTGRAERLTWSSTQPDVIVLEGKPARTDNGRDSIEANRLVHDRRKKLMVSSGATKTELHSSTRQSSMFDASQPIMVRSSDVELPLESGWAEFRGPVRAWQAASDLRCEQLRTDRSGERLEARGSVSLTRRVEADPASAGQAPVRLLADQLDYDASTRRAVLLGQARYQAEKLRLNAERIDLLLDEHQAVQELIAGGAVRLEVGKNVGICDRLEWTGGEAGVAWLIGSDSFASLTSPDAPPLRGQRLRYDLASGSFTAEGGVGKTVLDKDPSPPPTSP